MSSRHSDWGRDDEQQPYREPRPAGEPVALAEGLRLILMAGVAAGWFTLDDHTVNLAITAVGIIGSVVATVLARARVTPIKGSIWDIVSDVVEDVLADRIGEELDRRQRARRVSVHPPERPPEPPADFRRRPHPGDRWQ